MQRFIVHSRGIGCSGRDEDDGLPFWLDICNCSDVVLARQHELVVNNPFWLVVERSRGMQGDRLVMAKHNVELHDYNMLWAVG